MARGATLLRPAAENKNPSPVGRGVRRPAPLFRGDRKRGLPIPSARITVATPAGTT